MATITFTIPDGRMSDLVGGICLRYGYQSMIEGPNLTPIPNPESRAQFAKRMILEHMKQCAREYLTREAEKGLPPITDVPIS